MDIQQNSFVGSQEIIFAVCSSMWCYTCPLYGKNTSVLHALKPKVGLI